MTKKVKTETKQECPKKGFQGAFNPNAVAAYFFKPNRDGDGCNLVEFHYIHGGHGEAYLDPKEDWKKNPSVIACDKAWGYAPDKRL